ncbi:sugar phosphate nucleotidyltransferase [Sphingobacterium thalpophilum]|uniref:sugar phosphate nucleotidyltransferase n=1 Tax=Sphingobacterium thalpophilum TaxID=259 RepID=UPI0037DA0003
MTNAIILAAGKGVRMLPLTENTPKPLLSVLGERIIERQIRFLKEAGIENITIVTGYLNEKFLYLKDKYCNIDIVVNDLYESSNNFYSLFLVRDKLENTWIIEGDIFMVNNLFGSHDKSVYYTSPKPIVQYEWYFQYNENQRIQSIHVADRQMFPNLFIEDYYINMGVSYWCKQSCATIGELFESLYNDVDRFNLYKNSYWDKLIVDYLDRFDVYIHIVNESEWYEIDSVDDLNKMAVMFKL